MMNIFSSLRWFRLKDFSLCQEYLREVLVFVLSGFVLKHNAVKVFQCMVFTSKDNAILISVCLKFISKFSLHLPPNRSRAFFSIFKPCGLL